MPARQGGAQPQPVAQERRPVGDLVGEVVAAASGPRARSRGRSVGPYDRRRAARRDLGHARVVVDGETAGVRGDDVRVRQGRGRPLGLGGGIGHRDGPGAADVVVVGEAAAPGPVGPLDVETAHPALADGREEVHARQLPTEGALDRALGEVLPADGEDGRLDARGPVGGPDHRSVEGEGRGPGRVGDPHVPVQRERIEPGDENPLHTLAAPRIPEESCPRDARSNLPSSAAL